jgi:hypothetical protein
LDIPYHALMLLDGPDESLQLVERVVALKSGGPTQK